MNIIALSLGHWLFGLHVACVIGAAWILGAALCCKILSIIKEEINKITEHAGTAAVIVFYSLVLIALLTHLILNSPSLQEFLK